MYKYKLGVMEDRFANIIWNQAPLTIGDLIKSCEVEFGWKRTTVYTVLKKFEKKGIFENHNKNIVVLITKEEFYALQSEEYVQNNFNGSLMEFLSIFLSRKKPSKAEIEEILRMIEEME